VVGGLVDLGSLLVTVRLVDSLVNLLLFRNSLVGLVDLDLMDNQDMNREAMDRGRLVGENCVMLASDTYVWSLSHD
jgi:hypothetical protein